MNINLIGLFFWAIPLLYGQSALAQTPRPGPVPAAPVTSNYPTQAIRMLVPYPAGGGSDSLIRAMSAKMSERLGQTVIIDNRPGGNTAIGTQLAANSRPDGYTYLVADQAHIINPFLMPHLPYDILRDFAPVALLANSASILVVHPSLPVHTVNDLIALARAHPGQINYASGGNGTTTHMIGELINAEAHIKMVHIPYKGAAPAIADIVAGQVSVAFNGVFAVRPLVESGRLRAIAISGTQRKPAMPQVPTFIESGWPSIDATSYRGLVAPMGTPLPFITKIYEESIKCLETPEVHKRLLDLGYDPTGGSPQTYDRIIRSEMSKWGRLIRQVGIRLG